MADETKRSVLLLSGGAAGLIIGSFMPWVKALGIVSVSGIDGDGIFTLIGGGFLGFAAWRAYNASASRRVTVAALVVALLMAALVLFKIIDISSTELVTVGFGLWVCLFGAVAAAAGSVLYLRTPPVPPVGNPTTSDSTASDVETGL